MITPNVMQLLPVMAQEIAPTFRLDVAGKAKGEAADAMESLTPYISSISYEEDASKASVLEVTIINQPKSEKGKPDDWRAIMDNKVLAEGNAFDLYIGYGKGKQEFVGRCEITKWMPTFPEGGPGTLTVTGYDGRHQMLFSHKPKPKLKVPTEYKPPAGKRKRSRRGSKKKKKQTKRIVYKNTPDEQIVEAIAKKYGFLTDCDITEGEDSTGSAKKTKDISKAGKGFKGRGARPYSFMGGTTDPDPTIWTVETESWDYSKEGKLTPKNYIVSYDDEADPRYQKSRLLDAYQGRVGMGGAIISSPSTGNM